MLPYLLLILGFVILLYGGKILVDGASAMAVKLGMSAGLIGMTVVAFGTSAPELLVSVNAALKGNSDISIGNVIGSNIANIALVLGISGIFYPILIKKIHIRFDYVVTLLVSILFYGLSFNGIISFWEGILLFSIFIGFNYYLFKSPNAELTDNTEVEEEIEQVKNYSWFAAIGLFIGGVVGLYAGSELLVNNAVKISREFGVSERIIGVTVIAIGTSLPELITSIMAALAKRTDLALGNILGSNIMNILSIIGITAIIKPIGVSQAFIDSDFLWMLGITVLLFLLMRTKMRVSKVEGSILLLSYFAYMYFLL
ncbi:calcium/sodium antiporter [Algoriphagus halophytocola]|uniref:Calcium/sodium antiporter n=1 Tax=Algoriphagus halophytocola TaxID=2991499 RepID=A0ABY6MBN1_9BACT|nr:MULTISPECIES: calcium/sodium antiporter [unclassified Algoriphagus]UZD20955.1 calcium/sodium antiporter [Algoriphagus sp. TR-M5]WBL42121.1 calcium/sodium antiporter [Algoriphagus sp. TR-M9]